MMIKTILSILFILWKVNSWVIDFLHKVIIFAQVLYMTHLKKENINLKKFKLKSLILILSIDYI